MNLKKRILLEVVFFVVIFFGYQSEGFSIPLKDFLISVVVYLVLYAHGLVNRFLILPFITQRRKIPTYIVLSLINLLAFSFVAYRVNCYFIAQLHPEQLQYFTFYNSVASCLLGLFVMSSLEFVIQYFQREKEKAEYQATINLLQTNSLKAQLNPHFLFNSLNNAYGLSLSQPERTPAYIMQLSQLMRYQLESTRQEYVQLKDELQFVQNYLAIEKERIGKRCDITLANNLTAEVPLEYKVIPMLFSTFVENAIKHGASGMEPSKIDVSFDGSGQHIVFTCVNTVNIKPQSGTELGLKNVQQRLNIMYGKAHTLDIQASATTYTVHLKLKLDKYV